MKSTFLFFITYILSALIFSSCNSSDKKKTSKNNEPSSIETRVLAEIKSIDELILNSGKTATSLNYSKQNGASIVVQAHFSSAGKLLKLDEKYNEGNNGNYGTNSFYFNGKNVIASKEVFEDNRDKSEIKFVERMSFYTIKGDVIKTLEKRVNYEEELDGVAFLEVSKQKVDITRAQKVLNQVGEFETTFQGFVVAQALKYIVVGAASNDGYTSAIRINNEDDFTQFVAQNEKKHLNRKVKISFEHVVDPTGFEYQSYLQGQFED